ncbi:hypothetical protein PMAN_a0187 [Pseudoalteromonas marina]|nr:hypothetical protein PMAN_a0187 [Pseudoalteromonas marina]
MLTQKVVNVTMYKLNAPASKAPTKTGRGVLGGRNCLAVKFLPK